MPSKDRKTAGTKLPSKEYEKLVNKAESQNLSVCAVLRALTRAYLNDEIELKKGSEIVVVTHK